MSNNVYWILTLNIKPGRSDAFHALAADMVAHTQENEPATLNYEWTVNADKSVCHIFERYVDSDAVMVHLAGFQEHFMARFLDILEVTGFNVYGPASDQARGALSGFGAVFMDNAYGFAR